MAEILVVIFSPIKLQVGVYQFDLCGCFDRHVIFDLPNSLHYYCILVILEWCVFDRVSDQVSFARMASG